MTEKLLDREWNDLHRRAAALQEDRDLWKSSYDDLENGIIEAFNPPDSDSWHPMVAIESAVKLIESLPCACPPDAAAPIFESDPCERCAVLGRRCDVPNQH